VAILGGIGVVIIAACVLAWFAARTWHWGYVIVVVGIVLFSAGFFILSAEVLRVNAIDRSKYNKAVADVERATKQVTALEVGSEDPAVVSLLRGQELKMPEDAAEVPGISKLEHQIRMITQLRGPVWRNVTPAGFDQQAGTVRATIAAPTPPGLSADAVVYVFEDGPPIPSGTGPGRQYLGEFRVVQVAGQDVTLTPSLELAGYQLQRLAASRGPWVIYETMPLDQHHLFADKTEEELRRLLPAASIDEYLRHGKETTAADGPLRKAGYDDAGKRIAPDEQAGATKTVYRRRIRDYATELRKLSELRALLQTSVAGAQADNQHLAESIASAEQLTAFRRDQMAKLTSDLSGLTRDRQAVDRLLTMVEQQREIIQRMLDETLRQNSELARQLAAIHAAAAASGPQPQANAAAPRAVAGVAN
jgi:hypothetical protein